MRLFSYRDRPVHLRPDPLERLRRSVAAHEAIAEGVARVELAALDGGELPPSDAGAHIEVVIALKYQRAFRLSGNPAERRHDVGVCCASRRPERAAAGAASRHCCAAPSAEAGRCWSLGQPTTLLGARTPAARCCSPAASVSPIVAMGHRLQTVSQPFALHFSAASRGSAVVLADLAHAPWEARLRCHFKDQGTRADLCALVSDDSGGLQLMKNKRRAAPGVFPSPWGDGRRKAAALRALYTCSAARHRNAVFEAAQAHGWP